MYDLKMLISGSCLALILLAVDTICYSNLPIKIGSKSYTDLNMALYIYSSFISQIIYNLSSKMKTAIITGPIVENFLNFEFLIQKLIETCGDENEKVITTNAMVCMFLTAIFFGAASIAISKLNGAALLKKIPKPAITGSLAYIGYTYIFFSLRSCSSMMVSFAAFCSSMLILVLKRKINSQFTMVGTVFGLCLSFHILKCFISTLDTKEWIVSTKNVILDPVCLFRHFRFNLIDHMLILKNSHHILFIVVFSFVHVLIKYPIFAEDAGVEVSYNDELQAQGTMNMFSSLVCMPCYFTYGYSLILNKMGCKRQIYGIIIAIQYLYLVFFLSIIKNYIPNFVVPSLTISLGMEFVISVVNEIFMSGVLNICIVFVTFLSALVTGFPICGVFCGVACYYFANFTVNRFKKD